MHGQTAGIVGSRVHIEIKSTSEGTIARLSGSMGGKDSRYLSTFLGCVKSQPDIKIEIDLYCAVSGKPMSPEKINRLSTSARRQGLNIQVISAGQPILIP